MIVIPQAGHHWSPLVKFLPRFPANSTAKGRFRGRNLFSSCQPLTANCHFLPSLFFLFATFATLAIPFFLADGTPVYPAKGGAHQAHQANVLARYHQPLALTNMILDIREALAG